MPETVVFITEVIQFIFKANSFFTVNKKSFHFTGTRKTHGESELKNTEFQKIQEQYWHKLLEERRKSANNRRRFQGSVSFLPSNYSLLYMPNIYPCIFSYTRGFIQPNKSGNNTSLTIDNYNVLFLLFFLTEMGEKDFRSLIEEFPDFNESDIVDLRLQFQTFDLNQDGIIDFQEL